MCLYLNCNIEPSWRSSWCSEHEVLVFGSEWCKREGYLQQPKHARAGSKKKKSQDDATKVELYVGFRYCSKKCFVCNICGYFWGPAHKNNGMTAYKRKVII